MNEFSIKRASLPLFESTYWSFSSNVRNPTSFPPSPLIHPQTRLSANRAANFILRVTCHRTPCISTTRHKDRFRKDLTRLAVINISILTCSTSSKIPPCCRFASIRESLMIGTLLSDHSLTRSLPSSFESLMILSLFAASTNAAANDAAAANVQPTSSDNDAHSWHGYAVRRRGSWTRRRCRCCCCFGVWPRTRAWTSAGSGLFP